MQETGRLWTVIAVALGVICVAMLAETRDPTWVPKAVLVAGFAAAGIYVTRPPGRARPVLLFGYLAALSTAVLGGYALATGVSESADVAWDVGGAVLLVISLTVLWWHLEESPSRRRRGRP